MDNKECFNILLPTYNSIKYLDDLLKSLSKQNFKDFIILTYDDNSIDQTIKLFDQLCQKYQLKYKRIKSINKNIGPLLSYEKLIEAADSKYIALCDHDDYWLPNKLSAHYSQLMDSKNKPTISITNAKITDKNLIPLNNSLYQYMKINQHYFKNKYSIAIANKVPGICMAFNSSLKNKLLPISEFVTMHDWWILLVSKSIDADIKLSEEITVLYRQHPNNTIGLNFRDKEEVL